MKKALIIGITGQDGSYLAEFLLSKGYEVHGLIRRASTFNTYRINHLYVDPHLETRLFLHYGDLLDDSHLLNLIYEIEPDEIYHLGAQSHVRVSFDIPIYTGDVVALGTNRILESMRRSGIKTKMYNAASSEMFGSSAPPQNESTPFKPRSPYAISKLYAFWTTKCYRESYGLFAVSGILFNHESPRRGETFVTRKITMSVANILAKKQDFLYLGNLDASRDWGYAPEYVEGMWKMLQQNSPEDFVLGTGSSSSVRDFVEHVFSYAGLDWQKYVRFDKRYVRPLEVDKLLADASKAKKVLHWKPSVKMDELAKIMLDSDMRRIGLTPIGEGDEIVARKFPSRWWKVD